MLKIQYDSKTKDSILTEQASKDMVMVEDAIHLDGKFLTFVAASEIKEPSKSLEARLSDLEKRVAALDKGGLIKDA